MNCARSKFPALEFCAVENGYVPKSTLLQIELGLKPELHEERLGTKSRALKTRFPRKTRSHAIVSCAKRCAAPILSTVKCGGALNWAPMNSALPAMTGIGETASRPPRKRSLEKCLPVDLGRIKISVPFENAPQQ